MKPAPFSTRAGELFQQETLNPALTRALRGTAGFVAPLIVGQLLGMHADIVFAAMGGQVVALTDVRGAYRFRFVILLVVTLAITGAAFLGTLAAGHLVASMLAVAALALLAGAARHLSGDYGPGLGIVAALLFIMGLALPAVADQPIWHHASFAFAGGLWGIALQAALWPFRPQHALRESTGESWMAVSEFFAAMRPGESPEASRELLAQRERELRATLDRTQETLVDARTKRGAGLINHLEELRVGAARLGTRAAALHSSLDLIAAHSEGARLAPAIDSLLLSFTNLTRSAALTIVTHRPVHYAATEVRLNRCSHLTKGLIAQTENLPHPETASLHETLRQIDALLTDMKEMLHDTVDRGSIRDGFPLRLPELSTLSPRSLLSWVNPASRPDPLLIRHTLRMAIMTMLAIGLYEIFQIPRGYWIAFTLIVVLQPDYGATRERAAQRILGTLAGSALASAFLWVRVPLEVLDVLIAATVFGFAYFQKQRYGLAVFFVTLMLVLLTETSGKVDLSFTISRLLCNLAGGLMALGAALLFWPSWERKRFPPAMADALRGNAVYLKAVLDALVAGRNFDASVLHVKRAAETANSMAAASLQRMAGEPARLRQNVDRGSALLHSNTRLTRAITAMTLQLREGEPLSCDRLGTTFSQIDTALGLLATDAEKDVAADARLNQLLAATSALPTSEEARGQLVETQLGKILAELRAMTLAIGSAANATT